MNPDELIAAEERLVEYFKIIKTVEKNMEKNNKKRNDEQTTEQTKPEQAEPSNSEQAEPANTEHAAKNLKSINTWKTPEHIAASTGNFDELSKLLGDISPLETRLDKKTICDLYLKACLHYTEAQILAVENDRQKAIHEVLNCVKTGDDSNGYINSIIHDYLNNVEILAEDLTPEGTNILQLIRDDANGLYGGGVKLQQRSLNDHFMILIKDVMFKP